MLRATNDEGVRTVVTTRDGLSIVTDEPISRGGTGSAPSPLETVVGALCGCSAVTFERATRDLGLDYGGIDFDAAYRLDGRGLLGEAEVRPYFDTVDVDSRVRTTAPERAARRGRRRHGAPLPGAQRARRRGGGAHHQLERLLLMSLLSPYRYCVRTRRSAWGTPASASPRSAATTTSGAHD